MRALLIIGILFLFLTAGCKDQVLLDKWANINRFIKERELVKEKRIYLPEIKNDFRGDTKGEWGLFGAGTLNGKIKSGQVLTYFYMDNWGNMRRGSTDYSKINIRIKKQNNPSVKFFFNVRLYTPEQLEKYREHTSWPDTSYPLDAYDDWEGRPYRIWQEILIDPNQHLNDDYTRITIFINQKDAKKYFNLDLQ